MRAHLLAVRAAALVALAGVAIGAAHADTDASLLAAARAAQPAVIDSLREMVAIESGSSDVAGLDRMADYTEQRLKALGARVERSKGTTGPGSIVKGSWTGTGTRKLMLMAHMDTVYPHGTLASETYHQDGNKLYGPGIADDKGGIAVILHSVAILNAQGWKDYAQLTVLFNADEEIGSVGSGEAIAQVAEQHDYVFSSEPTAAKDVAKSEALLLGAAGTAVATMEVKGRASHAGAAPELGRNALIELAYQLQRTMDVAKSIPGTQLNWTRAQAGVVDNQIPENATATADVRITVPGADQTLRRALVDKVASGRLVADAETTVRLDVGRPPYLANDRARAFATEAQAIYRELDGRVLALVPMTGGATDAGYAGRSGTPVVLESFGLAGFGYHARNEYVEIDSIVPRLYLMTRMLQTAARAK